MNRVVTGFSYLVSPVKEFYDDENTNRCEVCARTFKRQQDLETTPWGKDTPNKDVTSSDKITDSHTDNTRRHTTKENL